MLFRVASVRFENVPGRLISPASSCAHMARTSSSYAWEAPSSNVSSQSCCGVAGLLSPVSSARASPASRMTSDRLSIRLLSVRYFAHTTSFMTSGISLPYRDSYSAKDALTSFDLEWRSSHRPRPQ